MITKFWSCCYVRYREEILKITFVAYFEYFKKYNEVI